MREILFRGKQQYNGEWVVSRHPDGSMLAGTVIHDFIPETVGQYTGLTDKNGNRIFEGDILQCNNNPADLVKVVFGAFTIIDMETESAVDEVFGWHYEVIPTADPLSKVEPFCFSMPLTDYYIDRCGMVIVGNVHDNPELLGGVENA